MSAIWINPLLLATWTHKISSDLTTRRKARQVWGLPFQKEVTSSNQSMRLYRNLRKTEQSISSLKNGLQTNSIVPREVCKQESGLWSAGSIYSIYIKRNRGDVTVCKRVDSRRICIRNVTSSM